MMGEKTKISELKPYQRDVSLSRVEVVEISPVKEFQKFGEPGKVCNVLIKDSSGQVSLTLWNEQIEVVEVGSKISISNATVKEWQGYLQINTGRNGSVKVLK